MEKNTFLEENSSIESDTAVGWIIDVKEEREDSHERLVTNAALAASTQSSFHLIFLSSLQIINQVPNSIHFNSIQFNFLSVQLTFNNHGRS